MWVRRNHLARPLLHKKGQSIPVCHWPKQSKRKRAKNPDKITQQAVQEESRSNEPLAKKARTKNDELVSSLAPVIIDRARISSVDGYIFCLKLRYGGRIEQSRPPRYLEGRVKCFADMDSDEWGMMTLKEKVYEVGYKEEDSIRLFSLTDNGLIELLTDEDACALANYVVRPKLVEIWVVLGVVGNDEENNGEAEISADEGDSDSDWMIGDYANELPDSEFEIEQTGVDDLDFFNFIDPNVGVWSSEGEGSEGNVRAEENDREPDEGNGRESDTHRPVLPSPLWGKSSSKGQSSTKRQSRKHVSSHYNICKQKSHNSSRCPDKPVATNIIVQNQLGVEGVQIDRVTLPEEISINTQPEYASDIDTIPVDIQIQDESLAPACGFEILVEVVHVSTTNIPGQSLNIGDEITAHAVKPSYGPPQKKMKTINSGKGKQLTESHDKAKGKKSLGLIKARTQLTRKYRTRSSMVIAKSKYGGNDKDPINID
nr:transposase, MuDR [Ipomoea batatas]